MVNPEALLVTNEYVRKALDQIIQVNYPNTTSPMQFLHLVDAHMLTRDYTFFQEPRKFALNDLLVLEILTQYRHQRTLHGFSFIERDMTLSHAADLIAEDAMTGNADLIGWSWLYFHYVEINLRISQHQFCHMVNLDDRTIRRYQNSTLEQLTKYLIQNEQASREIRRKQILFSQLPHQGNSPKLIGRENELKFARKSTYKHCFVVGAAGIGKTVFVEQLIKEQIDNNELDRVVWIHSPTATENVKSYLREQLLTEDSKITLVEYVSLKKTAIVIDNAGNLQEDPVKLNSFLEEFSNANIFLTSQLFDPIPYCLQIDLHELSLVAIEQILSSREINDVTGLNTSDLAHSIWQTVGGNPLAVELLAQNWIRFELQTATLFTLDQLFSRLFDSMTLSERLAWLTLALLTDESFSLSHLSEINLPYVSFSDFVTLERLSIAKTVRSEKPTITLTLSASRYIQLRYESDLEMQHLLDQLIADLRSAGSTASQIRLALIESALSLSWVALGGNNYMETVRQSWKLGMRTGHYTKWYVILGKLINVLSSQNLDLAIAYGISQRCLGQLSQSYSTFTAVIEYSGMHGAFAYQAKALLELAILLRHQGDYVSAITALDRVDHFPDAITYDLQPEYRTVIERIEIALESNNLDDAKSLLLYLSQDEPYRLILQLEIYAKDTANGDELPFLASLSDKLLLDFSYSSSLTARVHILIGRLYHKLMDTKAATKHISIALSILTDIDNDPFALARTQSNLAVLLLASAQLLDAQELLKSAENIQRKIGDRVGLAVTMHNEHVLDRKIVG